MNVNENIIKKYFSEKTFSRGLDYYNDKRVFSATKLDDILYGKVSGTSLKPYEVKAQIGKDQVRTECTCPVGRMCKHGVALLLKWAKEPNSFVITDKYDKLLKSMSKEELVNMIKDMIKEDPSLAKRLITVEDELQETNIDEIKSDISSILYEPMDYYGIHEAVLELKKIKGIADKLKMRGKYKDAIKIYLELVAGCIDAYDKDTEDDEGELSEFGYSCIEEISDSLNKIPKKAYDEHTFNSILDIIVQDGYGFGSESMLNIMLDKNNIAKAEDYLLKMAKREEESYHDTYMKDNVIEILSEQYARLGMHDETLRLSISSLKYIKDYERLALAQMGCEKYEDALLTIKKGLKLPKENNYKLCGLYFEVANILIHKKPDLIEYDLALKCAIDIISWRFDEEKYEIMKKVFAEMGKLDNFRSRVQKSLKIKDNAVYMALHDDDINKAIDIALKENVTGPMVIHLSQIAFYRSLNKESALLTKKFLEECYQEQGMFYPENKILIEKELAKNMVDILDKDTIALICNKLIKSQRPESIGSILPFIADKYPDIAINLVDMFNEYFPVELINDVVKKLSKDFPEESIKILDKRIGYDILRSHVYYDKAIGLLSLIKEIYGSIGKNEKWRAYINDFISQNKYKKKLLNKINQGSLLKNIG
jgi:uncharacterized Zn finger protein